MVAHRGRHRFRPAVPVWLTAAVLLCAGALSARAQDAPAADTLPRRVLLVVSAASGSGLEQDGLELLSRSILIGLQTDPGALSAGTVFIPPPAAMDPASDEERAQAARVQGADAWLWVEALPGAGQARVLVRSFDIARNRAGPEESVTIPGGLAPLGLPDVDWSAVAGVAVRAFSAAADAEVTYAPPASSKLSIRARAGTVVSVTPGPSVKVDEGGSASVTLDAPAAYTLRATAPGLSPARAQIFLTADREVTIPQVPAARWAVEASLADLTWPEASLSWFAVPDWVSLGIGATTYLLGFALNGDRVFSSAPLANLSLRVGAYILPADSGFRLYAALSGFVRLIHAPAYFGLDPLSPVGARLAIGAEIARTVRGGFFLEYTPTMYFTKLPQLFRASLGSYDIPPGWLFEPGFALNLITLRLGYRWTL